MRDGGGETTQQERKHKRRSERREASDGREIAKTLEANRVVTGTPHDDMFHSLDGVVLTCGAYVRVGTGALVQRLIETSAIESEAGYDA